MVTEVTTGISEVPTAFIFMVATGRFIFTATWSRRG